MNGLFSPGKILIAMGAIMLLAGLVFLGLEKLPWFGRLPGDINIQREKWSVHIPIVTCIIISIILTLLLNLFTRRR